MTEDEKRRIWKHYHRQIEKQKQERSAWSFLSLIPLPPLPESCRGLTCGAKRRDGKPCPSQDLYTNGRCRAHGGLSTGPRTLEGKRRSAMNVPGKTYEMFIAEKEAAKNGQNREIKLP